MRKSLLVCLLSILCLLLVCSCGEKPFKPFTPPSVDNVVLISIDTLRADHVGAYGYPRKTTPNIDRLAKESIRFSQAFSSTNWTLPAHAGMFSGMMSSGHGAIGLKDAIRPQTQLIAEHLNNAGVTTGAFVSHVYVSEKFGFHRGFETFDYEQHRSAAKQTDQAIDWMKQNGASPFFLFLHYFDVHAPYGDVEINPTRFTEDPECYGPKAWADIASAAVEKDWPQFQCFQDLYDGDLAYVDEHLGRLFDHLRTSGLLDRTLVIVTSDHGEMFGEYEAAGHGLTLFDPEIWVPLIMRFPDGAGGGTELADLVSNVQLAPTILEVFGQTPFPTDLPSLLPRLRGEASAAEWVGVETQKLDNQMIAVIDPEYKAVMPPPHQIYGVNLAPSLVRRGEPEDRNIWFEQPDIIETMTERIAQSGWYGSGTCYEMTFFAKSHYARLHFEVTLPEGVEPVTIAPLARYVRRKGKKVFAEESPVTQNGNTFNMTLPRGHSVSGFAVVVDPADTEITIKVPGIDDIRNLPLFVGQTGNEVKGETVTLNGPTGSFEANPRPMGAFVLIRSYPVSHLQRPGMGPIVPAAPLSQEERNALRALGYLGP